MAPSKPRVIKLFKVSFSVEQMREGEAFVYFATEREAGEWITLESPHDLTMDYEQDVVEVDIPVSKKGLADYLNTHHVYW